MDLQQEWKNFSLEMASKEHFSLNECRQEKPNNLLSDVFFKLKWKLRWVRIIDLPVLALALLAKGDLQLVLLFFFLSYEICRWLMIKHLNKIKAVVDYSLNTKQVLEENFLALTSILRIENLFGYIFIPITGPIGFIAAKLYRYQTFEKIFDLPNFPLQLALCVLAGIPLIFLAKKANNYLFSAHINDLKNKMAEFNKD